MISSSSIPNPIPSSLARSFQNNPFTSNTTANTASSHFPSRLHDLLNTLSSIDADDADDDDDSNSSSNSNNNSDSSKQQKQKPLISWCSNGKSFMIRGTPKQMIIL